jgi:hypothetical protein
VKHGTKSQTRSRGSIVRNPGACGQLTSSDWNSDRVLVHDSLQFYCAKSALLQRLHQGDDLNERITEKGVTHLRTAKPNLRL